MAWVNVGQLVWPVGSIYFSSVSTSPADLFGGTWAAIDGEQTGFLRPGTSYGTKGGSNTHTHMTGASYYWGNGENRVDITDLTTVPNSGGVSSVISTGRVACISTNAFTSNNNGGRRMMSTYNAVAIPEYTTVYAWRRTA